MNPYRLKSSLWLVAAVLAAGVVVVAAGAVLSPVGAGAGNVPAGAPAGAATGAPAAARAALAQYAPAWKRPLRSPLYPPPPPLPPPPPPPEPKPKLSVRLRATVVEPGFSQALLAAGKAELWRCVGEAAGDAKVLSIADGRVVVLFAGERHVLILPKPGAKP